MMKKVRNRDSPTRTWLGGEVWVPRAWRSSDMTMMMRVKLVVISTIAGMKDSEVISSRVCIDRLYWVPPPAAGVLVRAGRAWASTGSGASRHSGAQRAARWEARRRRDFIGNAVRGSA